jgi:hypothetical protein
MSGWREPIASDMMKSPNAYDRSGPNSGAGALAWVAICRAANAPHGEEVFSITCGANQMTAARTPTFKREADVSCIAPLSRDEGMVLCMVSTFGVIRWNAPFLAASPGLAWFLATRRDWNVPEKV